MGENTKDLLLKGDGEASWFLAEGEQYAGPLTLSEIYDRIVSTEITWAHYVWKAGWPGWKRICDTDEFKAAVPMPPTVEPPKFSKPEVRTAEKGRAGREPQGKVWFLYCDQSQSGPFLLEEVDRLVRIGRISPRAHAWRDGMSNWERLEKLSEFNSAVAAGAVKAAVPSKAEPAEPKDQRSAPRRPLIARVIMVADKPVDSSLPVSTAMCRDVSVGGMQVLTDRIPGAVGTKVRLNVSPTGEDRRVPPFTSEGVIVRLLEDGRGFSFRFEKLGESARKIIEQYISEAD